MKNHTLPTVFISYSHADKKWLDLIRRHFKPISHRVEFWDDSNIAAGQVWREEIEQALKRSSIALLLISADFLSSDFILTNELPPLLKAADQKGTTILSLILKPCLFDEHPELAKYQAVNSLDKTLSDMKGTARERLIMKLMQTIVSIVDEKASKL